MLSGTLGSAKNDDLIAVGASLPGINGWDAAMDAPIHEAFLSKWAPPVWTKAGVRWMGLPVYVSRQPSVELGDLTQWCINDYDEYTQDKMYAAKARMGWMKVPKPFEVRDENGKLIWKEFPEDLQDECLSIGRALMAANQGGRLLGQASVYLPWDVIWEGIRLAVASGQQVSVGSPAGQASYAEYLKSLGAGATSGYFHHRR